MFDYTMTIEDTAYVIFLNFYKTNKEMLIMDSHDIKDIIEIIAVDFDTDAIIVERDISNIITRFVKRIPNIHLNSTPPIIH